MELPEGVAQRLGKRLYEFWRRFRERFKTKTRDTSEYAHNYLGGLLRMEEKRNFANIASTTGVAEHNLHHFMSNSPWSARAVIQQERRGKRSY